MLSTISQNSRQNTPIGVYFSQVKEGDPAVIHKIDFSNGVFLGILRKVLEQVFCRKIVINCLIFNTEAATGSVL